VIILSHRRAKLLRSTVPCALAWAGLSLAAPALALDPPAPIKIDGGPLGALTVSGGLDGYVYGLSGNGNSANPGLLATDVSAGAEFTNGLIRLQKTEGLVQFNIALGGTSSFTLGTKPAGSSAQTLSTGPLYSGYLTLAPNADLKISVGILPSIEGFESPYDWRNANLMTTAAFYVENAKSQGVSVSDSFGPLSLTVTYGDGFDSGVLNYVQGLATYTINTNNALSLYGATNLGHTGSGVHYYGSASLPYDKSYVGSGPTSAAPLVNSSVIGGYYSYTVGALNIAPELQYVYTGADSRSGLTQFSSNFTAALFAAYSFGKSPWSVGAWAEYFSSSGPDFWFISPGAKGFGVSISPTWQHKAFFVRGDLGVLRLTDLGTGPGFGANGADRTQATAALDFGVLF
jgi:hypothetical protein